MELHAIFHRKEPQFETSKCMVEKIIELEQNAYWNFRNNMLQDQNFIAENNYTHSMRVEQGKTHCLLVLGKDCDNGILVNSEGSNFARYAAFIPGARSLLAAEAMYAEKALMNEAAVISDVELGNVFPWMVHIRELAEEDAHADGPAAHFDYCRRLKEFRKAFWQIGQVYETSPAAIFNSKLFCRPEELLPAADFISHGGTLEEAADFIRDGAFQPVTYAADIIVANSNVGGGNVDVQCMTDFQGYYRLDDNQMVQLWAELQERNEILRLEIDKGNDEFRVVFAPSHSQSSTDVTPQLLLEQDDLDIIHAKHMLWCHDQPGGERADFSGQMLRDLCFMRMRFSETSFLGATLENCCLDEGRFFGCDFGDATLTNCTALGGAEFVGAKFMNAAITGCSFEKVWCMETSFIGTWIEGCNFTGADLDNADFTQAELIDCEGLEDISQGPAMTMGG